MHAAHTSSRIGVAQITYEKHFPVLAQFYLSFATNVLDAASVSLLALTSHSNETAAITQLLHSAAAARSIDISHLQLRILDLPQAIRVLNPTAKTDIDNLPFDIGYHWGRHGTTYICLKKAFAAWYALEVLKLNHVMVTDSEARAGYLVACNL